MAQPNGVQVGARAVSDSPCRLLSDISSPAEQVSRVSLHSSRDSCWLACMHCLTDSVKGGELGYMSQAIQREHTAYSSLLMVDRGGPDRP